MERGGGLRGGCGSGFAERRCSQLHYVVTKQHRRVWHPAAVSAGGTWRQWRRRPAQAAVAAAAVGNACMRSLFTCQPLLALSGATAAGTGARWRRRGALWRGLRLPGPLQPLPSALDKLFAHSGSACAAARCQRWAGGLLLLPKAYAAVAGPLERACGACDRALGHCQPGSVHGAVGRPPSQPSAIAPDLPSPNCTAGQAAMQQAAVARWLGLSRPVRPACRGLAASPIRCASSGGEAGSSDGEQASDAVFKGFGRQQQPPTAADALQNTLAGGLRGAGGTGPAAAAAAGRHWLIFWGPVLGPAHSG